MLGGSCSWDLLSSAPPGPGHRRGPVCCPLCPGDMLIVGVLSCPVLCCPVAMFFFLLSGLRAREAARRA
jgi:hypothetical protein